MSLIEHMNSPDWEPFLSDCFRFVLEVLAEGDESHLGSGAADLKGWLRTGGLPRVELALDEQMALRHFSPARRAEVHACLKRLGQTYRDSLLRLAAEGRIGGLVVTSLSVPGFSEQELADFLDRLAGGERPFEEWMYAHGRTTEEVAALYRVIDGYLRQAGIEPPPFVTAPEHYH